MVVNAAGDMVQTVWNEIPMHYAEIEIDEFVVMPNHIHGIIVIDTVGATPCGCPKPTPCGCPKPNPLWLHRYGNGQASGRRAGTGCPYGECGDIVVGRYGASI